MTRALLCLLLFAAPVAAQTTDYPFTITYGGSGATYFERCQNLDPCVALPNGPNGELPTSVIFSLPDGPHTLLVRFCNVHGCVAGTPLNFTAGQSLSPPALLAWQFETSTSPKFTGTTWTPGLGHDGQPGHLAVIGAKDVSQTFPAVTSGTVRFDWWYRIPDTQTFSDGSGDLNLYLLPASGPVLSSNSAGFIAVRRSTQVGATATTVKLQTRNGSAFVELPTAYLRGDWHKLSVIASFATKTSQIFHDDGLLGTVSWPNQAITELSRIGLLTWAQLPESSVDSMTVTTP
jgi:hypothetical protein